jgi:hypothetical protein
MPACGILKLPGTMPRGQTDVNKDTWHEENRALDLHSWCSCCATNEYRIFRRSAVEESDDFLPEITLD